MNTVRILLSLTTHYNWQLLQYDVKNAFLHGDLDEEIYMNIPSRFEGNTSNTVCKLKKAIYGLKQSPRAWFGRFAKVMKESGYKQSQGDHTLFIKHSAAGGVITLLVYVDDIIMTGNDEREKHEVKQRLAIEFEIKELGKLKYFLGIEVAYSTQGIFISQQKFVIDLLAEIGKIGCKPVSTLMDLNHKLGEAKEEPVVDKRMYQRLVGRLIYLAHTWTDITYSVSMISQFMHDPKKPHLQAAYRVLHYLKGNLGKGILFKKNNTLALEAYTDADYAGSLVDRRSTTGYCTFLAGNPVTWRSKKQNVVARSSVELEFRFIAQGLCELLWLKIILNDLRIKWDGPLKLYCDKKSAINIAHNPIQHDRTKHIEIDRHFIKEKLEEGVVCMSYVPSEHQLADILTKGLNNSMFTILYSSWEWKTSIPQLEGKC
ncbi:Retrovirus-related Pol polyprotein from transposon RE1 [Vitis vinifera]|uniref:Retrovirus-related Pol polyprotein from transposon RE1 n=1 Tax=Vitis vinifera TaxID=29760 RepID=A0A438J001_VITVI|nr:Retrovirus-related Pol polyprotein from transposon RE1 [Vitis vinifera]